MNTIAISLFLQRKSEWISSSFGEFSDVSVGQVKTSSRKQVHNDGGMVDLTADDDSSCTQG